MTTKNESTIKLEKLNAVRGRLPEGVEIREVENKYGYKSLVPFFNGKRGVGFVFVERKRQSGYYYREARSTGEFVVTVTSPRIPPRSRYDDEGTRRFQKVESAALAVMKFCAPNSTAEDDLNAARKHLDKVKDETRDDLRAEQVWLKGGYDDDGWKRPLFPESVQDAVALLKRIADPTDEGARVWAQEKLAVYAKVGAAADAARQALDAAYGEVSRLDDLVESEKNAAA